MKTVALVGIGLICWSRGPRWRRNPRNPRAVEFTSPDHAAIASYEIAYFAPGAPDPVMGPIDIGKPAQDVDGVVHGLINTQPMPFGAEYVAKVRAVAAGGIYSDWSEASNPFDRVPGSPSKPALK